MESRDLKCWNFVSLINLEKIIVQNRENWESLGNFIADKKKYKDY